MFKASSENRFEGPHQKSNTVHAGVDVNEAKGAMIMIHGRGATAESIIMLADEFGDHQLHLVAPQAQGFQWYPNSFLAPSDRNEPGISSGLQQIYNIIEELEEKGIPREKIILLGFSQGACLASEFIARHPAKYGGLAALSGGLIGKGDTVPTEEYSGSLEKTPIFLGCSNVDAHIPQERVDETAVVMENLGGDVNKKIYKGMGHTVNRDEIDQVKQIISKVNGS